MNDEPRDSHSIALLFFNDFEARTVEAIAERIIPGDDGNPGATDAGVVYYIDRAVAGFSVGLQKAYRLGLREFDRYCRHKHKQPFVGLHAERQDALVRLFLGPESGAAAAERRTLGEEDYDFVPSAAPHPIANQTDDAERFDRPLLDRLFAIVREHAIEGLFCDPAYGGNRNAVGWRLVGFPGVHWGYTAEQMKEGFDGRQLPIQTLSDLRSSLKDQREHFASTRDERL